MTIYIGCFYPFFGFPSFRHNNVVNFGAKVIILLSKYTKGEEYSIKIAHVLLPCQFRQDLF